jgi:hypothetical protein
VKCQLALVCRAFRSCSQAAISSISVCLSGMLSRDNLDENGGRQSEFEAAAGSEGMIALSPKFRKRFSSGPLFDCR